MCGAAIQWLRDNLQMIKKSSISENFASKVPDSDGVASCLHLQDLEHLTGNQMRGGAILGIKRSTKKEHIVRGDT